MQLGIRGNKRDNKIKVHQVNLNVPKVYLKCGREKKIIPSVVGKMHRDLIKQHYEIDGLRYHFVSNI